MTPFTTTWHPTRTDRPRQKCYERDASSFSFPDREFLVSIVHETVSLKTTTTPSHLCLWYLSLRLPACLLSPARFHVTDGAEGAGGAAWLSIYF